MNEFNRCQTQLKDLYSRNIGSECMTEFICYQLLYCLYSQQHIDTNHFLKELTPSLLQDTQVQVVLKIFQAIRTDDYFTFFHIYYHERIPFECKHFMTYFFKRLRLHALFSIFNTYVIKIRNYSFDYDFYISFLLIIRVKPTISLYMLKQILHYSSYEDTVAGLRDF